MIRLPEADWRRLRDLAPVALDRFCAATLAECERTISRPEQTNHERYLALYDLIRRRDKQLATIFDGLRRSDAWYRLILMVRGGLLTDDEMARFSAETLTELRERMVLPWGEGGVAAPDADIP